MAQTDKPNVDEFRDIILQVADEKGIDPAIIAAIISRESRGGTQLLEDGSGRYDENGFGLMQVDQDSGPVGGPRSIEHIRQATDILIEKIKGIQNNFPDWTPEQQLKGGIAAYNIGVKQVWTYENMDEGTTGDDYANDVVARAQWYKQNGY
ncbi:PREDICTED: lysozyme g-like [Branchiostoma belcheri]|uniref:Lysozyme g n=1 Tax=Branchiostoma belcheri TaxID=7741 RepID=A0A6P4ZDT3_BRABE|nr:PREDICTED: lysozyme g-like [Branchiostoma belcheri]